MTAPVAPDPQAPAPGAPVLAPAPGAEVPAPDAAVGDQVWPPDPQTMIQMMMDARFSIIDEPAGDVSNPGANRAETAPAGTPPPQPQAQG